MKLPRTSRHYLPALMALSLAGCAAPYKQGQKAYRLGQMKEARMSFKKVAARDSDFGMSRLYLGLMAWKEGNAVETLRYLNQAKRLVPAVEEAEVEGKRPFRPSRSQATNSCKWSMAYWVPRRSSIPLGPHTWNGWVRPPTVPPTYSAGRSPMWSV